MEKNLALLALGAAWGAGRARSDPFVGLDGWPFELRLRLMYALFDENASVSRSLTIKNRTAVEKYIGHGGAGHSWGPPPSQNPLVLIDPYIYSQLLSIQIPNQYLPQMIQYCKTL